MAGRQFEDDLNSLKLRPYVTGDAIIRREGIFPHKRLSPNSVAVLMMNPLDYAKREAFSQATESSIEEVSVVSATLFETLLSRRQARLSI